MKTVNVNVYSFDELSKEVQAKVLDKHRYFNVDGGIKWYDYTIEEYIKENIMPYFETEETEVRFSGFSSQGDGLMFEYSNINLPKLIEKFGDSLNVPDRVKGILKSELLDVSAGGQHVGRYSHERSCSHDLSIQYANNHENIEALIDEHFITIEEWIETVYISLCTPLYRLLESEYDGLTSDEYIKEGLIANELHFLENGQIWN